MFVALRSANADSYPKAMSISVLDDMLDKPDFLPAIVHKLDLVSLIVAMERTVGTQFHPFYYTIQLMLNCHSQMHLIQLDL